VFHIAGGLTVSGQPNTSSNSYTVAFIVILCTICGTLLALLATGLKDKQDHAQELDRSKQLLIAARMFHRDGYFLMTQDGKNYIPAKMDKGIQLVPGSVNDKATSEQITQLSQGRIKPLLVDIAGEAKTFAEAKVQMEEYLSANKKAGYANLPLKLIYAVLPNKAQVSSSDKPESYIIPINGRALWDSVYGYLAIENNGNTVIGTSWYKHAETPGLGANITEESWQSQFSGKVIFQPDVTGKTDFATAPIGLTVIKGKVKDIMGNNPKGMACIDGMAGATLTGNGITKAYKDSLTPYKPFFLKLHAAHGGQS
jgi:Na+-transporting NADH:ubiquinone oxidoreductase subunit C